jgi:radical SAM protein with 4Fe4S-binding SPASM domain
MNKIIGIAGEVPFNFIKSVAVITSACLLYTSVFAPALYALSKCEVEAAKARVIPDEYIIPSSCGRITDAKIYDGRRIIVNIQDLHCNPEVQRNIAGILESLDRKYGLKNVYVEGGYGDVDTSWLCDVKDNSIRRKIAESLVDQGRFTGSEYYSVISNRPHLIKGLEDETLHKANIVRLGRIIERKNFFEREIGKMDRELAFMQVKYCTSRTRKLNKLIEEHRSGNLPTEKYYIFLAKYAEAISNNPVKYNALLIPHMEDYPNMRTYMKLMQTGKHLNYKRISRQMQGFVAILKEKLPYQTYRALFETAGNMSRTSELPWTIAGIAQTPAMKAQYQATFPDLYTYFGYLEMNRELNSTKLLEEERRLVEAVRVGLAGDVSELEVSFLAEFNGYFKDYLLNRITADDYQYFTRKFGKFQSVWSKYAFNSAFRNIAHDFDLLDEFYKTNCSRNDSFLRHIDLADVVGSERPAGSRADSFTGSLKQADMTVLVTGGFHTEGLKRLLSDKNISCITITPNVTRDTSASARIYATLAEQQFRLFSSQTLALALVSAGAKVVSIDPGRIAVEIQGEHIDIATDRTNEFSIERILKQIEERSENIGGQIKEGREQAIRVFSETLEIMGNCTNPLAAYQLVSKLVIIFAEIGAERNWFSDTGILFDIVKDENVQKLLCKEGFEIEEMDRMPEYLQRVIEEYVAENGGASRISKNLLINHIFSVIRESVDAGKYFAKDRAFARQLRETAKEYGVEINENTKVALYIGGSQIRNSYLISMFNDIVHKNYGYDLVFLPVEVADPQPETIRFLEHQLAHNPRIVGANITAPCKVAFAEGKNNPVGAVNFILKRKDHVLEYDAVDGRAWIKGLNYELKETYDFAGKKIAIIGSGGAAREIAAAVDTKGLESITFIDIDQYQLAAMKSMLEGVRPDYKTSYLKNDPNDKAVQKTIWNALYDADIIVNATGVGRNDASIPIQYPSCFHEGQIVCELMSSVHSQFLKEAERRNVKKAFFGRAMVVYDYAEYAHRFLQTMQADPDKVPEEDMFFNDFLRWIDNKNNKTASQSLTTTDSITVSPTGEIQYIVDLDKTLHLEYGSYTTAKWLAHNNVIKRIKDNDFESLTPVTVQLVPSLVCNYRCATCTYGKNKEKIRRGEVDRADLKMSLPDMKKYVDELARSGVKGIVFTGGGEPLTNEHTIDGMAYAKSKGIQVALFTNGSRLDADKIRKLLAINPYFIRISLNAGTPEIHQLFHGTEHALFEKVIDNLKTLAAVKKEINDSGVGKCTTEINVGVIVSPWNVKDIENVAYELKKIDDELPGQLGTVAYRPTMNYVGSKQGVGVDKILEYVWNEKSIRQFYDQTKAFFEDSSGQTQFSAEFFALALRETERAKEVLKDTKIKVIVPTARMEGAGQKMQRPFRDCLAGPLVVWVAPNGSVYTCVELSLNEELLIGNLKNSSIQEIWNSPKYKKAVAFLKGCCVGTMCPTVCMLYEYNIAFNIIRDAFMSGDQTKLRMQRHLDELNEKIKMKAGSTPFLYPAVMSLKHLVGVSNAEDDDATIYIHFAPDGSVGLEDDNLPSLKLNDREKNILLNAISRWRARLQKAPPATMPISISSNSDKIGICHDGRIELHRYLLRPSPETETVLQLFLDGVLWHEGYHWMHPQLTETQVMVKTIDFLIDNPEMLFAALLVLDSNNNLPIRDSQDWREQLYESYVDRIQNTMGNTQDDKAVKYYCGLLDKANVAYWGAEEAYPVFKTEDQDNAVDNNALQVDKISEVTTMKYSSENKMTKGRLVIFKPETGMKIWVNQESLDYDFAKYATTTQFAKEQNKKYRFFPGLTIKKFVKKHKPEFAVCGHHSNFWMPNGVLVKDGKLITKPVAGVDQTQPPVLNGIYDMFVLDPEKQRIESVTIKDNKISGTINFMNAINGPVVIRNGNRQDHLLEFKLPPIKTNEIPWNAKTKQFAFAVLGKLNDGRILSLVLAGDPDDDSAVGLQHVMDVLEKLGNVSDAILLGTSTDVQQYVNGSGIIRALPSKNSSSGNFYEVRGGRTLSTILYIERSPEEQLNVNPVMKENIADEIGLVGRDIEVKSAKEEAPCEDNDTKGAVYKSIMENRLFWEDVIHYQIPNPQVMEMHLGTVCNNNCVYCYSNGKLKYDKTITGDRPLEEDEINRLIDTWSEMGVKSVIISGGLEPFTNKYVFKAIDKMNKLGMDVTVLTNGSLIHKGDMNILLGCEMVRFSLDSFNKETYKRIRGVSGKLYSDVMRNLSDLIKLKRETQSKTRIAGAFLVLENNYERMEEVIEMAREYGLDEIEIKGEYSGKFNEQQFRANIERLKERYGTSYKGMKIKYIDPALEEGQGDLPGSCWVSFSKAVVDPFGNLYPCCTFAQPGYMKKSNIAGNVRNYNGDFRSMWIETDGYRRKLNPSVQCSFCPYYDKMVNIAVDTIKDGFVKETTNLESTLVDYHYVSSADLAQTIDDYGTATIDGSGRYHVNIYFLDGTTKTYADARWENTNLYVDGKPVWAGIIKGAPVLCVDNERVAAVADAVLGTVSDRGGVAGSGTVVGQLQKILRNIGVDLPAQGFSFGLGIDHYSKGKKVRYGEDGSVIVDSDYFFNEDGKVNRDALPARLGELMSIRNGESVATGRNMLLYMDDGFDPETNVETLFCLKGQQIVVDGIDKAEAVQAKLGEIQKLRHIKLGIRVFARVKDRAEIEPCVQSGLPGCVVDRARGLEVFDFICSKNEGIQAEMVAGKDTEEIKSALRKVQSPCCIIKVSGIAEALVNDRDIIEKAGLADLLGDGVLSFFGVHVYSERYVRNAAYGADINVFDNPQVISAYLDLMRRRLQGKWGDRWLQEGTAEYAGLEQAYRQAVKERRLAEKWIRDKQYTFSMPLQHKQMLGKALALREMVAEAGPVAPAAKVLNDAGINRTYQDLLANPNQKAIDEFISMLELFDMQLLDVDRLVVPQTDIKSVAAILKAA